MVDAKFLREWRESRGWSARECAEAVGVPTRTLEGLEQGRAWGSPQWRSLSHRLAMLDMIEDSERRIGDYERQLKLIDTGMLRSGRGAGASAKDTTAEMAALIKRWMEEQKGALGEMRSALARPQHQVAAIPVPS